MIFVDTSFWFAWQVSTDVNHATARMLLDKLWAEPTVAHLRPRLRGDLDTVTPTARHGHAVAFIDALQSPRTRVITRPITPRLAATAWAWLRKHGERAYSFADASSFSLMREVDVRDAFAFDGDFAAAGFVELRIGRRSPVALACLIMGLLTFLWVVSGLAPSRIGRPVASPREPLPVGAVRFTRGAGRAGGAPGARLVARRP